METGAVNFLAGFAAWSFSCCEKPVAARSVRCRNDQSAPPQKVLLKPPQSKRSAPFGVAKRRARDPDSGCVGDQPQRVTSSDAVEIDWPLRLVPLRGTQPRSGEIYFPSHCTAPPFFVVKNFVSAP